MLSRPDRWPSRVARSTRHARAARQGGSRRRNSARRQRRKMRISDLERIAVHELLYLLDRIQVRAPGRYPRDGNVGRSASALTSASPFSPVAGRGAGRASRVRRSLPGAGQSPRGCTRARTARRWGPSRSRSQRRCTWMLRGNPAVSMARATLATAPGHRRLRTSSRSRFEATSNALDKSCGTGPNLSRLNVGEPWLFSFC